MLKRPTYALAAAAAVLLACAGIAQAIDGSPDATFGGDGVVLTSASAAGPAAGNDQIEAIARQPDGKIVVAGSADNDPTIGNDIDFAVARYNPDGTLDDNSDDAGFGSDGIVTTAIASGAADTDRAFAMAIQPDGKIVVAGESLDSAGGFDFAVVRYNADGSLDDTGGGDDFSTDGVAVTPTVAGTGGGTGDLALAVAIQADDKIVAGGFGETGTEEDMELVRYNADGTLDSGFDGDTGNPGGGNGIVATDITGPGHFEEIQALAIQSDAKIVAVGGADNGTSESFTLARYNGSNGTLDTAFDGPGGLGNGKFTTSFGAGDAEADSVVIQGDGKIVAAGLADSGGNKFALARYLASNGDLDAAFDGDPGNAGGGNGKVMTSFGTTADARSVAIAPDGKLVAAGRAGGDFAAARYNAAAGTLDTTFAGDGTTVTAAAGGGADGATGVVVQPDSKVVAAGSGDVGVSGGLDFALVRWGPAPPVVELPPTPTPTQEPSATAPTAPAAPAPKHCKKGQKLKKGKCVKKKRKR